MCIRDSLKSHLNLGGKSAKYFIGRKIESLLNNKGEKCPVNLKSIPRYVNHVRLNPKEVDYFCLLYTSLSDFEIPADSLWAGYTLRELNLGHKYGVHVASIIRGMHRINIPGANEMCIRDRHYGMACIFFNRKDL